MTNALVQRIVREPKAHEWEVLESYAARVQVLDLALDHPQLVGCAQGLLFSYFALNGRFLLPSLKQLFTSTISNADFVVLYYLATPTLQIFDVEERRKQEYIPVNNRVYDIDYPLALLTHRNNRLEQLALPVSHVNQCKALAMLRKCQKLRKLALQVECASDLDVQYIETASELLQLQSLKIHVRRDSDLGIDIFPPLCDGFSKLNRLVLEHSDQSDCVRTIRNVPNFISLSTLVIDCSQGSGRDSVPLSDLLQAVSTKPSLKCLTNLTIKWHEAKNKQSSFAADLSILYALNLTALSIDTNQLLDLDEHDLVEIAQAWPRLETLHLFHPPYYNWPSLIRTTHLGAGQLLQSCPSLHRLQLPFVYSGEKQECNV